MKHLHSTILILIISNYFGFSQTLCTYSDQGSATAYTLLNGETLCIQSGTFTGNILSLPENAEIRVAPGAVFQPSALLNASGLIINDGTMRLNSSSNFLPEFSIQNDSGAVCELNSSISCSGAIHIFNARYATLKFNTPYSLAFESTLSNEGIMSFSNSLNSSAASMFSNDGVLYIHGDFNLSGIGFNSGVLRCYGFSTFANTSMFVNKCTFTSQKTLSNYSAATENYGYLEVAAENGSTDNLFLNSNSFYNDPNGVVQTTRFTNTSNVVGAGTFIATGLTQNSGNFGADGAGINFYDVSQTGTQIFDLQNITPDNSVTRYAVSILDTNYISSNCNQIAFPIIANNTLPVLMGSFETVNDQCHARITWTTVQENNSNYFDLERKATNTLGFIKVASISAQGTKSTFTSYNYFDNEVKEGTYQYRLKIVDQDGHYTYSKISSLKIICGSETSVTAYPNPAHSILKLSLKTNEDDSYFIRITDMLGHVAYSSENRFGNGFNSIQIPVEYLANGCYDVVVTNNIRTKHIKFIKN